ncbi:MAG: RluA family pseudouridine synthase [Arachidicoccus sp.]|nr:RluA family pseudouridine synthase [Arachidicoccus sp.]
MKLDIIFENEDFVVINKPSGLLSVPDRMQSEPSLKDILKEKYGDILTVHRLDKFTSGLIVFAKNADMHKMLSQLFEGREVEKFYIGLVKGNLYAESGTIEAAIAEHPAKKGLMTTNVKGKTSVTDYKVVENFKNYSLVEFQIRTGRTHQIRVHLKHIGSYLVCDELYGDGKPLCLSEIKKRYKLSKNEFDEKPLLARLALHSFRIKFVVKDIPYSFEAPLHKDFQATLQQLRKNA